jgi:hypothetical protein
MNIIAVLLTSFRTIPGHDVQMSRDMQILNFSTTAVAYALGKNRAVSLNT